ncbi:MAG: DNA-3-methyladenine glycosylase [Alphaproteobacteria bacterium]|nr:DNA-3-methyladenine glycosylase [Alphaproteobacteria bacterium]
MSQLNIPAFWQQSIVELSAADPIMASIIASYEGETLVGKGNAFLTLARAIVGQQISVKAADAVWFRLEAGLDSHITPEQILSKTEEELRGFGLSRQKALYLHDLSRYFNDQQYTIKNWSHMSDDELISSLTSIRGIGRWTAEMFLIFHLLRPDVFPVDDIGLQKAVWKHYFAGEKQPLKILRNHGELWRPWRSVATWYLWRSLDPVAVAY